MHCRAIVPYHDVAFAPLVQVTRARRRRKRHQLFDQLLSLGGLHTFHGISVRGEVDRAAAVHGIFPHHAPALRRQRRALLGTCKIGCDLLSRVRVIMPGKGIFELLAQAGPEAFEGKAGRDELGPSAINGDDTRRENRGQSRHALE